MSAPLRAKLVAMANQIATAFEGQRRDAVKEAAAHIRAFWSPAMRGEILRHLAEGGEGLSPTARAAVGELATVSQPGQPQPPSGAG